MTLVDNWKTVLLKSWSVRLAGLGVALPELLQFLADNVDNFPMLEPDHKGMIRMAFLVGVILVRPIRQPAISEPPRGTP